MAVSNDLTFTQAVSIFLENARNLTEKEQPLVTSLEKIAEALDRNQRLSSSLLSEYTKTLRLLMKVEDATSPVDEIEAFLTRSGG